MMPHLVLLPGHIHSFQFRDLLLLKIDKSSYITKTSALIDVSTKVIMSQLVQGRVPCANVMAGGDGSVNCVTLANFICSACYLVHVCYHLTFIEIRRKQSGLVTDNDLSTVGLNARPRTGLSTSSIADPL